MQKTKYAFWMLLLPVVLAGSLAILGPAESKQAPAPAQPLYRQLDRFDEVLQRIRANYVDKPDDAKLIEGAIKGMLSELDPAFVLHECAGVPRLAGGGERQIWRRRT